MAGEDCDFAANDCAWGNWEGFAFEPVDIQDPSAVQSDSTVASDVRVIRRCRGCVKLGCLSCLDDLSFAAENQAKVAEFPLLRRTRRSRSKKALITVRFVAIRETIPSGINLEGPDEKNSTIWPVWVWRQRLLVLAFWLEDELLGPLFPSG